MKTNFFQQIAGLGFNGNFLLNINQDETGVQTVSVVLKRTKLLTKQDLFINSALANVVASLLSQLFREGILFNRGFFLNLADFRTQPLKVA